MDDIRGDRRSYFSWLPAPGQPEFRLLAIFLGIAGLTLAFGLLAMEVIAGDTTAFDRAVFLFFRQPGDPASTIGPLWLKEAARDLTALGSTVVLGLVFVSVIGYLIIVWKRAAALLVLGAVLGGQFLSTLLKLLFDRPRPDLVPDAPHEFTASFPSGHALLSAVTYLTLGALLARVQPSRNARKYLLGLAIILTVLIGISRVYLGVHWPTDVLAGWCVGSAWALLCWTVAFWLQRRGQVEQPDKSDAGTT
jgi:undecaprenyl-diphosphatase